jgi:peptide/nickel transport system substrate-binding protein
VPQSTSAPQPAAAAPPLLQSTPAAGAQSPVQKLGSQLVGKLEGPTVITDVSQYPKQFSEAPMLADLVKNGQLPPVQQRLPEEPLVLQPVHSVGRYGGTWRRGFTGPQDYENGNRIASSDRLLFCDYTGTKTMPSVAKSWNLSDDGKTFTLSLRKGMRWSDGQPFTADDIIFWYQDILLNTALVAVPPSQLSINGKLGTIQKVDDTTVAYIFEDPYLMFEEILRGDTPIGAGQATGGSPVQGNFMGGYAPAHYLKAFHATYTPKDQLDKLVADAQFNSWVDLFRMKVDWSLNPDLPVLAPWKTVSPITTQVWSLQRNPYYWAVDTSGNQLPYLDKFELTLAETLEVLNLRTIAGEYDLQDRHVDISKLPVLLDGQDKGNYKVWLDPTEFGTEACIYINLDYTDDAEIGRWLGTADFRRALSLGIDRDQLNETYWLGLGVPGSAVVPENNKYSPGSEYRQLWSIHDPDKANQMLDALGLDKKDADGYRFRSDGSGRLQLEIATEAAEFLPYTQIMQTITEQWKSIGIFAVVNELQGSLLLNRRSTGDLMMTVLPGGNTGSEVTFVSPANVLPNAPDSSYGPAYGLWFASNGTKGKMPSDPNLVHALELLRAGPSMNPADRIVAGKEIWKLATDGQWCIGLAGQSGAVMGVRAVKNNMGNVPERFGTIRDTRQPGSTHPEMFFFSS